jgi:hypothetical protein
MCARDRRSDLPMEAFMAFNLTHIRSCIALLAVAAACAGPAFATHPGRWDRKHEHEWHDARYHHDRYYPARGTFIDVLPPRAVVVRHGGLRLFFSAGVWYRHEGARYVVVAPPIGLYVPMLPPYYTTIYVRGAPYYYANDVYYAPSGQGYVVVQPPPANVVVEAPPASQPPLTANADQVFVYPRQGQTADQQAADRYACHQWAVSQIGGDPTTATGLPPQKRADYQRALTACLDGRGYTVR